MSDRSFLSPLEDCLFSSAVGDVLAARAAAIALLAPASSPEDLAATLTLTAMLVQAGLQGGGAVGRKDIQRLCAQVLSSGGPPDGLAGSSSQFVRYVVEEIRAYRPDVRDRLLGRLALSLDDNEPPRLGSGRMGYQSGAISQNRD